SSRKASPSPSRARCNSSDVTAPPSPHVSRSLSVSRYRHRPAPELGGRAPPNFAPPRCRHRRTRQSKEALAMSSSELAGTTALVTGATRGFGRAITVALHGAGAEVVAVARTAAALDGLRSDLGPTLTVVAADAA